VSSASCFGVFDGDPARFVGLTLRVKLCGRGPPAEADAARRLPRKTPEEANRDLQLP
jgi:hypothetical protein